jgi:2-desacetyl-2-hydroxyethyl bacteriochlorophyllide A dehydrogenase
MTLSRRLYFEAPFRVSVRSETLPAPQGGEVLVETVVSAISAGTELLFYRGQVPDNMALDANIASLAGAVRYPLRYGYAAVGKVVECGSTAPEWLGRTVFAFQPHADHFIASIADLQPVPDDVPAQQAAFLPNMETAVNFVMDGAPLIGERVAVIGQGVVGLLTTALLSRFPLQALIVVDQHPLRRQLAMRAGATSALTPAEFAVLRGDFDLVYELSGAPDALNTAIAQTGFGGRVVIGSWYGQKRAAIDLGSHFHRSRMRLISSQVSSIAPEMSGRWDKERRMAVAWEMLRQTDLTYLVTHRYLLQEASAAYALLDQQPADAVQVLFSYDN